MDEEEDLLSSLLAAATEQLEESEDNPNNGEVWPGDANNKPKKTLKETDIFQFDSNLNSKSLENKANSLIHSGDTDSSDDEGNRNYEDQKYSECGRDIKRLLNTNENTNSITSSNEYGRPKKRVSTWNTTNSSVGTNIFNPSPAKTPNEAQKFQDVFLDPIFCMRIVNPKISSTMLKERMQGRLSVKFSDLARQIFAGNLKDKDWVICGVVINKSPPKTSQKGSQYSIWTLTDLKDDFKTVALFMFSSAHKDLWKTTIGTVIGVLNPGILEKKDGCKDEVCFLTLMHVK